MEHRLTRHQLNQVPWTPNALPVSQNVAPLVPLRVALAPNAMQRPSLYPNVLGQAVHQRLYQSPFNTGAVFAPSHPQLGQYPQFALQQALSAHNGYINGGMNAMNRPIMTDARAFGMGWQSLGYPSMPSYYRGPSAYDFQMFQNRMAFSSMLNTWAQNQNLALGDPRIPSQQRFAMQQMINNPMMPGSPFANAPWDMLPYQLRQQRMAQMQANPTMQMPPGYGPAYGPGASFSGGQMDTPPVIPFTSGFSGPTSAPNALRSSSSYSDPLVQFLNARHQSLASQHASDRVIMNQLQLGVTNLPLGNRQRQEIAKMTAAISANAESREFDITISDTNPNRSITIYHGGRTVELRPNHLLVLAGGDAAMDDLRAMGIGIRFVYGAPGADGRPRVTRVTLVYTGTRPTVTGDTPASNPMDRPLPPPPQRLL